MPRRSPIASKTGWSRAFAMAGHTRAFLCLRARRVRFAYRTLELYGKADSVPAAQDEGGGRKENPSLEMPGTRNAMPTARTPHLAGWSRAREEKPAPITSSRRYQPRPLVNLQLTPNQVPGRMTRPTLPIQSLYRVWQASTGVCGRMTSIPLVAPSRAATVCHALCSLPVAPCTTWPRPSCFGGGRGPPGLDHRAVDSAKYAGYIMGKQLQRAAVNTYSDVLHG